MQQMGAGGRDQRPQQRSSDWPSVPESTTHSVPQVSSNSLRVSISSQEFELLLGLTSRWLALQTLKVVGYL